MPKGQHKTKQKCPGPTKLVLAGRCFWLIVWPICFWLMYGRFFHGSFLLARCWPAPTAKNSERHVEATLHDQKTTLNSASTASGFGKKWHQKWLTALRSGFENFVFGVWKKCSKKKLRFFAVLHFCCSTTKNFVFLQY